MNFVFPELNAVNFINITNCIRNKMDVFSIANNLITDDFDTLMTRLNSINTDIITMLQWLNTDDTFKRTIAMATAFNTLSHLDLQYMNSRIQNLEGNTILNEYEKQIALTKYTELSNNYDALKTKYQSIPQTNNAIKLNTNKMKQTQTKDIAEPCFEPTAVAPLPPELTPADIQQMIDCITNATNKIIAVTPILPNSQTRTVHRVNSRNIAVIELATQLAEDHPALVSPAINLEEWINSIENLKEIQPLVERANLLMTAINNYFRAEAIIAFQDFLKFYRCIKILAAEGVPEAMQIWSVVKVLYDNLRGKRGPNCGIKELKEAMDMVAPIIENNAPLLESVLRDEKRLAQNLLHAIHQEDKILDEAEHIN